MSKAVLHDSQFIMQFFHFGFYVGIHCINLSLRYCGYDSTKKSPALLKTELLKKFSVLLSEFCDCESCEEN